MPGDPWFIHKLYSKRPILLLIGALTGASFIAFFVFNSRFSTSKMGLSGRYAMYVTLNITLSHQYKPRHSLQVLHIQLVP